MTDAEHGPGGITFSGVHEKQIIVNDKRNFFQHAYSNVSEGRTRGQSSVSSNIWRDFDLFEAAQFVLVWSFKLL